tara:strand:+ start:470 stop:1390 length:921 start_codon:yes stop_codon:yes gene_type:complete
MPVGKKKSPAKFIGAVALGLGVIKGATSIIGGVQERKRLRNENKRAQRQYEGFRDDIKSLEITNPYKDLPTTFENTYEDMTVNQQQAQFEAQQGAQARANLLSNLQAAAGSSGIAGLAQALANQQQVQGQQISASIGQQEAVNQRLRAQGAAGVQAMEQQARRTIAGGEYVRQQNENQRQMDLMNLKAGRQQARRDFRSSMQAQNQAIMGGVGDILGAGLQGFAAGGGFTEDGFSMDTFLGRDTVPALTQNVPNTTLQRGSISGLNYAAPTTSSFSTSGVGSFGFSQQTGQFDPNRFNNLKLKIGG